MSMRTLGPLLVLGGLEIHNFGPGYDMVEIIPDYSTLVWTARVDNIHMHIFFDDEFHDIPLNRNIFVYRVQSFRPGKDVMNCRVVVFAGSGAAPVVTPEIEIAAITDTVRDNLNTKNTMERVLL